MQAKMQTYLNYPLKMSNSLWIKLKKGNSQDISYVLWIFPLILLLLPWLPRVRPITFCCLSVLVYFIYKTRCNFRIVVHPDLQFDNLVKRFTELQQQNPKMLSILTAAGLSMVAVFAYMAYLAAFAGVITIVILGVMHFKSDTKIIRIEPKDFEWSDKLNYDPELDDEFMPELNENTLTYLQRASDVASLTTPTEDAEEEEKSDEIPSELLIPDCIPEIDESSTDEEDLVPPVAKVLSAHDKQLTTSQNADELKEAMEFRKGHFKRDSSLSTSSSSEESLSKGLQFPDHTAIDGASKRQLDLAAATLPRQEADELVVAAATATVSAYLPSLLTGFRAWRAANTVAAEATTPTPSVTDCGTVKNKVPTSDSDSEFELIEREDFE